MASLKLSDSAFGTLGLTIEPVVDLLFIEQQLNDLGLGLFFTDLDLSAVTINGLGAIGPNTGDGAGLTVGSFLQYDALPTDITGFDILRLSAITLSAEGTVFDIRDGDIFALSTENTLTHDGSISSFDFSATGGADLDVAVSTVAPFDSPNFQFGFEVIGNAGSNVFYGITPASPADLLDYYGANFYNGGEGGDTIFGGLGSERLEGGGGRDYLFGEILDTLNGLAQFQPTAAQTGTNNDDLYGYYQNEPTLDPGAEDPALTDRDVLFGFSGDDRLFGGPGDDLLFAGQDFDTLEGGAGRDRFMVVEDYEIGSGVFTTDIDLGLIEVVINTGFDISSFFGTPNAITDFASGEDLLVFALTDSDLTFADLGLFFDVDQANNPVVEFDNFSQEVSYQLIDAAGTIGTTDLMVQVLQSLGTAFQDLDTLVITNGEAFFDASYEVIYSDPDESGRFTEGLEYDRFNGLQVTPTAVDGIRGGQDKFDLTAFNLGALDPAAVEDILFTTVDDYGPFTLESFSVPDDPAVADFFFDTDAQVDRAVHVEWSRAYNGETGSIAVYVDANFDGGFHPDDDLVYVVNNLQDGNGNTYGIFGLDLTKADLYADSAADGSGTGIFIFNDDQYDLWFNDTAPLQEAPA